MGVHSYKVQELGDCREEAVLGTIPLTEMVLRCYTYGASAATVLFSCCSKR